VDELSNAKDGITLPAMPEVLQELREAQRKDELDAGRISKLIASDVALSAEVLKTINSPLFSRGQTISSINTAVILLGPANVLNIVSATALRQTMSYANGQQRMDRFWDTAADVAYAAARYAEELSGIPADMAYTLGLFHDCGIAVMMQRYGDYVDTLKEARNKQVVITSLEDEKYPFNHARIGGMISSKWMLPESISNAISNHHRFADLVAADDGVDEVLVTLVALLKMAEHTSHRFRGLAFRDDVEDREWSELETMVLSHFDIDSDDFEDMNERLLLELGQR